MKAIRPTTSEELHSQKELGQTNKLKNNMPLYMYYRMQGIQIVELEYTNLKYTKTMSSIFNDNL
jgi:hypothetical protein